MKKTKQKRKELEVRTVVLFNTGTRVHKPKKGAGSYVRNNKVAV